MIRVEMKTATVAERPDLVGPGWERTRDTLPEYNDHGDVLNVYWGRLTEERPEFQFHLVDEEDRVLARVRSIPLRWNGTIEDLPAGIDGAIARGFDDGGANVLCALVIMVPRDLQSRGLSAAAVKAMREIARCHRLSSLIAPVRPSWKERYPLVPIERYATWRRADGLAFDPWMRVHERLGATILKPEPHSLRITGTVAEWEAWTQIAFPESGDYWFPRGLATVTIDREADRGRYWGAEYLDASPALIRVRRCVGSRTPADDERRLLFATSSTARRHKRRRCITGASRGQHLRALDSTAGETKAA